MQLKKNDPNGVLSVITEPIKDKKDYFRKAQVKLIKPIANETINEVKSSSLNPNLLTYVSISSIDKWEKYGNYLASEYIPKQEQAMPQVFLDIVNEASKEQTMLDQINKITTKLNEKVKYFGQWRSHKGKFIPQDLAAVADKQSGDCKDFAIITVKILRELGYQANVALVKRSLDGQEMENILPSGLAFNHAIVKLVDKSGRVYWIDPTNIVSMADGIFPDIASKHALVLDKEKSTYERIRDISEAHARMSVTQMIKCDETVNMIFEFFGEEAIKLTGAELHLSKKGIEDLIYRDFVSNTIEEKNRINSVIPNLTSRIVKPINIALEYTNSNIFFKSNLGKGYSLDPKLFLFEDITKIDSKNNINDLYLGHPRTLERKTIIKQTKAQNLKNLDFIIITPFVTLSRECYIEGEDSLILEKAIIHKSWIKHDEFKTEDFKKLQKVIREEIINGAVIL